MQATKVRTIPIFSLASVIVECWQLKWNGLTKRIENSQVFFKVSIIFRCGDAIFHSYRISHVFALEIASNEMDIAPFGYVSFVRANGSPDSNAYPYKQRMTTQINANGLDRFVSKLIIYSSFQLLNDKTIIIIRAFSIRCAEIQATSLE